MDREKLYKLSKTIIEKAGIKTVKGFDKRNLNKLLASNSNSIIIGPRRIGKTTLLEHVLMEANKSLTINNEKVIYLKLDFLEFTTMKHEELQELQILIRDIVLEDKISLLLLDEIQTLPNWPHLIKDIMDTASHTIRIVGTGSNSTELLKGTEFGIGRYSINFFGVLSFREMIEIKNLKPSEGALANYINYSHFPHYDQDTYLSEVSSAVIEKSFGSTTKDKTNSLKVLKWVAYNPGSEINAQKISSVIGISRHNIEDYFSVLQAGQLIFKLPNRKSLSGRRKVYTLIPGIFTMFDGDDYNSLSNEDKGIHFENFVLIQLLSFSNELSDRVTFEYINEKNSSNGISEIDFIKGSTAIEAKLTLPSDYVKYIPFAKKHDIKILYFAYVKGDIKKSFVKDGVEIKFIKYNQFADSSIIDILKSDLKIKQ